jgi:hypothetical protein
VSKPGQYRTSQAPSPWAIVLVGFLLLLVPALFCTGMMLTSGSKTTSKTTTEEALPKRPELNP